MVLRLSKNLSKYAVQTLIVASLLTVSLLAYLFDFEERSFRLEVDPSIKNLVPENGRELEIYRHTQNIFENDDYLLVVWLGEDFFTEKNLAALKLATRAIESLPGVIQVDSLATAMSIRSESDLTNIDPFLHSIPQGREQLLEAKDTALGNKIFDGQLISQDGEGTILSVHFDQELTTFELTLLITEIEGISEYRSGGLNHFLTGPLYMRTETGRLLMRDIYRVLPMAVLVTLFIAAIGFRNFTGPLLPAFSNILALSITLGVFVLMGNQFNFITAILPAVIYVVGYAYSVHVITEFELVYTQGQDKRQSVVDTLDTIALPITVTAITTALSFLSLTLSDIGSIQIFGLYAALGTCLAWIMSLVVVPAGLIVTKSSFRKIKKDKHKISTWLADFAVTYRILILLTGFLIFLISIAGASKIEVSTDYLANFHDDNPIHENFRKTNDSFAGAVPIQILLRAPHEDAFKDPQFLDVVSELQSWLSGISSIGGVYSIIDYLDILEEAFSEELDIEESGGRSKSLNSALLLFGGGVDADRYADLSFQETIIRVKTSLIKTKELTQLIDLVQDRIDDLPLGITGHVTGSSSLIAKTIDNISRGQLISLAFALLSIFLVLLLLFRSWQIALIALLPNALPLSVYFGYLGITETPLNITTSMVSAVVLGIAIDDSVHFLTRFKREYKESNSSYTAIQRTLESVGRPVTLTTIALCCGFITLSFGELQNQLEFGLLAAGCLFLAWLVDITFTPAICFLFTRFLRAQ